MLSFLPAPALGIITFVLYFIVTLTLSSLFLISMLVWLIIPVPSWRQNLRKLFFKVPSAWSEAMRGVMWLTSKTEIKVEGLDQLNNKISYLMIANHQGFLDISILQQVFDRYIPQLRYFMKYELLWFPIIGLSCYIMGYPFMKRHSRNYLKKHPEKRNIDFETTRKTCERFNNTPVTLINYIEGTRFTHKKRQQQASPYQHLLRPKAGGIAVIMSVMEKQIQTLLDVTIVYPTQKNITWTFLKGEMKTITIKIKQIPITADLRGDYQNDKQFRIYFQRWLNKLWQQKDEFIKTHNLS